MLAPLLTRSGAGSDRCGLVTAASKLPMGAKKCSTILDTNNYEYPILDVVEAFLYIDIILSAIRKRTRDSSEVVVSCRVGASTLQGRDLRWRKLGDGGFRASQEIDDATHINPSAGRRDSARESSA